jgi:hypothetical protein
MLFDIPWNEQLESSHDGKNFIGILLELIGILLLKMLILEFIYQRGK